MKKIANTLLSLSLSLLILFSLCSFTANAAENGRKIDEEHSVSNTSLDKNYIGEHQVTSKYISSYKKVSLTYNGNQLNIDSRTINGVTYVPIRAFINSISSALTVTYNSYTRTISVNGSGLNLSVKDGSRIVYANGRVLYTLSPSVIMTNGRMYTPLSSLVKALGLSFSQSSIRGSVKPLQSAEKYYAEDAVYWLSRIINAESRGETFLGQIAVGNVVLNRVASPLYPNTIWGVIFDRKYGVQFSPVLDGTIYQKPTESSVLAAKICLEGFSISNRTLFFLAPRYAQSSWIPNSRKYEFSIGNHDFYS